MHLLADMLGCVSRSIQIMDGPSACKLVIDHGNVRRDGSLSVRSTRVPLGQPAWMNR